MNFFTKNPKQKKNSFFIFIYLLFFFIYLIFFLDAGGRLE